MLRRLRVIQASVGILAIAVASSACTRTKKDAPGTVNLSVQAKIKGLDPIFTDDLYSANEVGRAYEGLLGYHYLKRPYTLIPSLAEAMPEISKDGLTYTFKIKKGVLFHDDPSFKDTQGKGRELTVEDFIYSFKRLADPKLLSTGWWVFDGKIVGLDEWREKATQGKADYAEAVAGLKAVDPYTLQIKLKSRSAQFLYYLAMPFTFAVPREAVEHYGKEFQNHAVGTGAFRLEDFNGNSKITWVKNPTYRKEVYPADGESDDKKNGLLDDAGKPLPLSERVIVSVFEESQPMWLNFMSGKLDTATIPKDNFSQAITAQGDLTDELKKKSISLNKSPQLDITHFTFNMADPLVGKNKYLRQAMSIVYDERPFIELFYNGRAIPAQGPIPPGLAGYDSNLRNPYRLANVDKAKELIKKAGFPEGQGLAPIEYNTLSDSTSRQMTEYAQKAFGLIGVQLKVNTYSWPEFVAALKNKKGQLWSFAWAADYPDAENFLQLFYSKNASPGPNDANYHSAEFDRLYEKTLTMRDTPERTTIYRKMVSIVVEDCPWIFNSHRLTFTLTQSWLKNSKPHEFDVSKAKYYRVDDALKK